MALAGLSTLGITFGYGVEATAGAKPSKFTQLTRVNSIGGISISPETIDASALEDLVTRSVAGRADNGGTWAVTINYTTDTEAEWKKVIDEYNTGAKASKRTWFEIIVPSMSKAFFVVAQPPQQLPLPELSQNNLLTMEINLTIEEYKGTDAKVDFTTAS